MSNEQSADLEVVWSAAIARIPAEELTGRSRALLRLTKPVGLMGTTALIAAPNEYTQNMIETKLRPVLNRVLSETLHKDVQIAVTIDASIPTDPVNPHEAFRDASADPDVEREHQPDVEHRDGHVSQYESFDTGPWAVHEQADSRSDRPADQHSDRHNDYQAGYDAATREHAFEASRAADISPTGGFQGGPADESGQSAPVIPIDAAPSYGAPEGRGSLPPTSSADAAARLNPRYTFENFVRGPSNRLAFAAASAVAEAPAKAYNPLFIYGDSGLGKTHLLHAIGHYALVINPDLQVLYVSSEEFTNDFINSIAASGPRGGDQREQFRRRYREVDILMIDDIQFLERAEQTQEEFFHTFNTLHNANKQIVITSDRTPKELTTLEDRLRSRFAGGLTPDIQRPDLETRLAILLNKAKQEDLSVSPEVLELVASKVQSNIRELEGALIRVNAFAMLNGKGVDLELAEQVIRDLVPDDDATHINAATIMQQVASYYDVSMDDLCGRNRSKTLVIPRQIGMYLCRELTDLSLPRIGAQFGGKDHTTVIHAVKKITNAMTADRQIYNQVSELTGLIKAQSRG